MRPIKKPSQSSKTRLSTFIDKVKVRYLADDDKHWAELVNFGNRYVHVPSRSCGSMIAC